MGLKLMLITIMASGSPNNIVQKRIPSVNACLGAERKVIALALAHNTPAAPGATTCCGYLK
jgi:hypothetical protein